MKSARIVELLALPGAAACAVGSVAMLANTVALSVGPLRSAMVVAAIVVLFTALGQLLRSIAQLRAARITAARCSAAVDRLYNDDVRSRLSGLQDLERIGAEASSTRQFVIDSVCRFLREEGQGLQDGDTRAVADLHRFGEPYEFALGFLLRRTRPETATFWPDMAIDLHDAVLVDFTFADACIRRATFEGTQFIGRTDLRNTRFAEYALFSGCRFDGAANFEGAVFGDDAAFDGTAFSRDALFAGARFDRDAVFMDATFRGTTQFLWSEVGSDAYFDGARFHREADFRHCRFEGRARFAGAAFRGSANYQNVHFSCGIELSLATFDEHATFDNATAQDRLFRSNLDPADALSTPSFYLVPEPPGR